MPSATLLLPARARFAGQPLPARLAGVLGRAQRHQGEAGEAAQLRRHFQLIPGRPDQRWPVAALTRQLDAGDAAGAAWVRADPVHLAPDRHSARMLGHGEALGLEPQDLAQLLPALKPVFGDAGFALDAPHPSRWYLRLAAEARFPDFAEPDEVLGDDLFQHLPEGEPGRRWRALLSETQVLLHNHPWNAQRQAQGRPAVNSLWFWGAGTLPDQVRSGHRQVKSRDPLLQALALAAGITEQAQASQEVDALVDLRSLRQLEALAGEAVAPLLEAMRRGELQALHLDFQDGTVFSLSHAQRWRFWRRPLAGLAG